MKAVKRSWLGVLFAMSGALTAYGVESPEVSLTGADASVVVSAFAKLEAIEGDTSSFKQSAKWGAAFLECNAAEQVCYFGDLTGAEAKVVGSPAMKLYELLGRSGDMSAEEGVRMVSYLSCEQQKRAWQCTYSKPLF